MNNLWWLTKVVVAVHILVKTERALTENNLYVPFSNWTFSKSTLQQLPIDKDERNAVRQVNDAIFSKVRPTPLKDNVVLVAVSRDAIENCLDINFREALNSDAFKYFASGNTVLQPTTLSHRYGGHQFGSWASQLGDGRAHLLGEYVSNHGERWELQLKGSGRTPYSRRGDGRAVMRSSIREFLSSEAMHYLSVPTSRAVSLVVADDLVLRDPFYDGNVIREKAAVVLRLAPSWFRFGSLEILAANNEIELLARLLDFIIENHFKHVVTPGNPNRYLELFATIQNQTLHMLTKWMSIGFAHGVCNTDNFSILSITIDYGPFGFVGAYDPKFIPNLSDDTGMYSLEKQPTVALFNLQRLFDAMKPVLTATQKGEINRLLNSFSQVYHDLLLNEFCKKLGLQGKSEDDHSLIASLLYLMKKTKADFTMTFRHLSQLRSSQLREFTIPRHFWALQDLKKHQSFKAWVTRYQERLQQNIPNVTEETRRRQMLAINPRYILRNWMAESAIRKAEKGDYSEIWRIHMTLQRPFEQQTSAEHSGYADRPPDWSDSLRVSCSS